MQIPFHPTMAIGTDSEQDRIHVHDSHDRADGEAAQHKEGVDKAPRPAVQANGPESKCADCVGSPSGPAPKYFGLQNKQEASGGPDSGF